MDSTYIVPTVTANRFIVSGHGDLVRIAFGENRTPESPINFRGAVAMTPYQAWELSKILQNVLGHRIAEFEAASNVSADTK
ncbi:hypothetical protein [Mesorhizobium sp. Cs1321R2N1]|uniref:hypothetical protein n=1 Tax=Mesorhizobium sp. Cs1321R2N1 TaxID=3015174 RepID=UPI00301E2516